MDEWTRKHLDTWLACRFDGSETDTIRQLMISVFDSDPEFYANVGWLAVYDAVIDKGAD